MRVKSVFSLLLCLCIIFSLTACSEDKKVASTEIFTDMLGREVELTPGSYKRVVCIGAGALRLYSYVGDLSLLCGVEDIDNEALEDRPTIFDGTARPYLMAYGDTFSTLPSCGVGGPKAQSAEAEKILSCNPDIVISEIEDAEKSNALEEQLGIPVITLRSGPDGVFDQKFADSLTLLGKIFGREKRAEELISFVDNEKTAITEAVKDIPEEEKPTVYACGLGNWGTASHLTTSACYAPFEIAGVNNAAGGMSYTGAITLEEEHFVSLGKYMDIMFIDAAAIKNLTPTLREDPALLDTCKAWQNGEVYLQMAYNVYYTNHEIALINTWFIAKTVYPEKFGNIDIKAKADEITGKFVGTPLADEIFASPSSFGGYQKIDPANFFK